MTAPIRTHLRRNEYRTRCGRVYAGRALSVIDLDVARWIWPGPVKPGLCGTCYATTSDSGWGHGGADTAARIRGGHDDRP